MTSEDQAAAAPAQAEAEPGGSARPAPPAPAGDGTGAARKEGWGETLRFFLILFLLAFSIRSILIAPFSIPTGSMLPNIMIGDHLFVAKWSYGYSRHALPFDLGWWDGRAFASLPERGDVAVFRHPSPGGEDWVKRVIGLPGDRIALRGGALILNGEAVPRRRIADWPMPVSPNSPCRAVVPGGARETAGPEGTAVCAYTRYRETLPGGRSYDVLDQATDRPGDDVAEFTVPEGHVFVMGDNRDDSYDGRFPVAAGGVGLLPTDYLLGRATVAFFSTDGSAEWLKPWTWVTAARWDRIGRSYR
jgi:signal peptidase I